MHTHRHTYWHFLYWLYLILYISIHFYTFLLFWWIGSIVQSPFAHMVNQRSGLYLFQRRCLVLNNVCSQEDSERQLWSLLWRPSLPSFLPSVSGRRKPWWRLSTMDWMQGPPGRVCTFPHSLPLLVVPRFSHLLDFAGAISSSWNTFLHPSPHPS